jgi:hypothetical protein
MAQKGLHRKRKNPRYMSTFKLPVDQMLSCAALSSNPDHYASSDAYVSEKSIRLIEDNISTYHGPTAVQHYHAMLGGHQHLRTEDFVRNLYQLAQRGWRWETEPKQKQIRLEKIVGEQTLVEK